MANSDKRRHRREDMVKVMECAAYHQSNQLIEFDCVSTNISQSGISLLTTEALKHGQEIKIRNHVSPYPRAATVRWKKEYSRLYYSYGLEFIEQLPVTTQ